MGSGKVNGRRAVRAGVGLAAGLVARLILAIAAGLFSTLPAMAQAVSTPHVSAELVAERSAVLPGTVSISDISAVRTSWSSR